MRGVFTSVNDMRRKVYAEVARLSYQYKEGSLIELEEIPYRITPGVVAMSEKSNLYCQRQVCH